MSETLLTDNWNSALNVSQWIMTGDTTSAGQFVNQIASLSNEVVSLSNQVVALSTQISNIPTTQIDVYLGTASFNNPVNFTNNYRRITFAGSVTPNNSGTNYVSVNGVNVAQTNGSGSAFVSGEIFANGAWLNNTALSPPISSVSVTYTSNYTGGLAIYGTK
jgi:hypothetical protein